MSLRGHPGTSEKTPFLENWSQNAPLRGLPANFPEKQEVTLPTNHPVMGTRLSRNKCPQVISSTLQQVEICVKLGGRQVGDGMGGGWNGRFWGTPILHLFVGKCCVFQGFGQKSGRPKNGRSNHHPSHPPLDVLLETFRFSRGLWRDLFVSSSDLDIQTMANVALGKSDQQFTPNFTFSEPKGVSKRMVFKMASF